MAFFALSSLLFWRVKLFMASMMFVLAYENRKRADNPKVGNIRIISDIDTNAGYDIQPYSSDGALIMDSGLVNISRKF